MLLANDIRRAIWQVDKDQPVWSVASMDMLLDAKSRPRRLMTWMLGAYAAYESIRWQLSATTNPSQARRRIDSPPRAP